MRLVVLSDPHGNDVALAAVLGKVRALSPDMIVCLGDVVGYFPDGKACLDRLRGAGCHLLQGNHEAMLTGRIELLPVDDEVYRLSRQKEALDEAEVAFLAGLSPDYRSEADGQGLLFVHGAPWDSLRGHLYPDEDWPDQEDVRADVVFMGHTHRQCRFVASFGTAVNVGSCGLPRDIGNMPGFCLYDSGSGKIELYRTEISVAAVMDAYPDIHPSVRECLNRKEKAANAWRTI